MKTMRNFMLLLLGVLTLAAMSACSSNSDDDRAFDEANPQIGTWCAETTSGNYTYKQTITLTKAGAFTSEKIKYNNGVEVENDRKNVEGYYTWDNNSKKATLTIEKCSYSMSTSSSERYLQFSFTPDFNSATLKSGIYEFVFSDIIYTRQ